jgi:benzoyl-CoA reductase subunit C
VSRVFNWSKKDPEEVLADCGKLLEDPNFPSVRRWREAGGRVVGHFQVYFPEELAHAAGLLPVKIRGATLDATQAESRFGSYLCSILKTSLELALSEKLELDLFVSHPICDAARNLATIWGRNVDYPCQILYLPQNANSAHTVKYLTGEYARMLRTIEEVAGHSVSESELRNSIGVFNDNRALLRELYSIKRETPWLLSAEEGYVLTAIAGILPREEHNDLLRWLLPVIRKRESKRQDRIRVVFEGGFCEQPPLDLIRTIGRNCYLVDDDLLIGLRYLLEDVPTDGDPLTALAHSYLEASSYSPVQHDLRKPKEKMLLERIRSSGADAAIVGAAKMCEPGLEEQVAYTQALDEHDIPYFVSEFQESMSSFEHMELQLETFAENLLFA